MLTVGKCNILLIEITVKPGKRERCVTLFCNKRPQIAESVAVVLYGFRRDRMSVSASRGRLGYELLKSINYVKTAINRRYQTLQPFVRQAYSANGTV